MVKRRRNPQLLTLTNPAPAVGEKWPRGWHRALAALAKRVPQTTNAATLRDEDGVREFARAWGVPVSVVAEELLMHWAEWRGRKNPSKGKRLAAYARKVARGEVPGDWRRYGRALERQEIEAAAGKRGAKRAAAAARFKAALRDVMAERGDTWGTPAQLELVAAIEALKSAVGAVARVGGQGATVRGNPSRIDAAATAYREFHGIEPQNVRQLGGSGPALVALGDLLEVVYRPTKGQRRGPAFVHKFGRGAVVAATPDGAQLVLVPSPRRPFRVDWSRGIIG